MTTILQDYFTSSLVKAGFPDDLEICYSLSYCQGDGMAFYGYLYPSDWIRLFDKMNASATLKERRRFRFLARYIADNEVDAVMHIRRNSYGYHYSHWNSMTLDYSSADQFELDTIRNRDKSMLRAVWDEFTASLEQYIAVTSRELESLGYRLIEAADVDKDDAFKTFDTANYRIEFKVEPIPFYASWTHEEFGYESVDELCQDALNGVKFVDLTATVFQKNLGIKMGESSLGYCTYGLSDKYYAGNRRYLVHEAISEARVFAQQAITAAQHLRQPKL